MKTAFIGCGRIASAHPSALRPVESIEVRGCCLRRLPRTGRKADGRERRGEPSTRAESATAPRTRAERRLSNSDSQGRTLVTGATGFLGHHLVAALSRSSVQVVALVRDPGSVSAELERQTDLVPGDLRDPKSLANAMQGVEIVFHCAAVTTNRASWNEHEATNIQGAENVFRAALEAGVRRIVHVSSVLVYGLEPPSGGRPVHESDPYPRRVDHWAYYLRSKVAAEQLAWQYLEKFGLPVTVARLGILYGPGGAKALRKDLLRLGPVRLTIGRGTNFLPFTYVDNAVDGLILAALSEDALGLAFNLVDDPQVTYRECTGLQEQLVGERLTSVPVPPFVLSGVARLLESKARRSGSETPPRLSRFVIRTATRNVRYDTSRAHEQLHWEPEIELEEGLRRSLSDFG